jgi:isopropylmalate/homocitrate/citramalate synthase
MLRKDPKKNLFYEMSRYEVEEVAAPDLMRDIFPYTHVPRSTFDGKIVPMEPAEEIWITDTTFRDGQQARPPYSVKQIVDLFDLLHKLGGPNGVIRATEFFLYTDKDKEAVAKCLERGYEFPEITGWIRATKGDFRLVKEMGLQETGILTSASDYHIFLKLKKTRAQAMEDYLDLVRTALDAGLRSVRCHLEDITRADFYGFVIPFAQRLMDIAQDAKKIVKIRMCDTMGYGLPYPEAALPRGVPKMVHALIHDAGVPGEWLEWHGHNDFHKVLVNAQCAWLYGCASANGTLLGFGERTGNPPIEALAIEYASLTGDTNGMDLSVITEIANYFKHEIKAEVPSRYPFVGDDFNTTSAGIHADGVLKDEEIYNIFDTTLILNRPLSVNVTDKSGIAGIAHWVNSYLGLKREEQIDKRHPGLVAIQEWVEEQYKQGRVTSISNEEMLALARIHLPDYFKSEFDELREKAILHSKHIIETLLEDPDIHSFDPAKAEPVLERIVNENKFIQFAYITDAEGYKVTRHITHPEDRETYEATLKDQNFADRDWFKKAVETGGIYITNFYISRITGALCITASGAITDGDKIKGVLGLDLRFEELVRLEE